jgi:hypothetical protein
MRLWKTTVIIWSDFDPQKYELETLAYEACRGEAYCSSVKSKYIQAEEDEDWDNTEFFTNKNEE